MTTARKTMLGGSDLRTPLAFAGVVVFGGLNLVAVRFSNQEIPPFFAAGVRFVLAALVFFAIMVIGKIPFPRGRALLGSLLYGVYAFALGLGLAYWALQELPASIGGLIVAAVPLLTVALAAAQGLENLHWRGVAGGLLAIAGIAVLLGTPGSVTVPALSVAAMAAAVLSFSQASIVVKQYPPCHPVAMNAIGISVGAVTLLPLSLILGEEWLMPTQVESWTSLFYLVIVGTVAVFGLFLYVLNGWPASRASYQFVLMPFVAALAGALLLDESINAGLIVGGAIVLIGVHLGALSTTRDAPPAPPDQEALALRCSTT